MRQVCPQIDWGFISFYYTYLPGSLALTAVLVLLLVLNLFASRAADSFCMLQVRRMPSRSSFVLLWIWQLHVQFCVIWNSNLAIHLWPNRKWVSLSQLLQFLFFSCWLAFPGVTLSSSAGPQSFSIYRTGRRRSFQASHIYRAIWCSLRASSSHHLDFAYNHVRYWNQNQE